MRAAGWFGIALLACAPKVRIEDYVGAEAQAASIDGIYWLAGGFDGPVQARLTVERQTLTIHPVGADRFDLRISRDGRGYEARATTGRTLQFHRRPEQGFVVVGDDLTTGLAWRVGPFPPELGGTWVLREPSGEASEVLIVGRAEGTASIMTSETLGSTELWPLRRPEVALSWVRVPTGGAPRIEALQPMPDGSWLILRPNQEPLVLHRPKKRPVWLPPPMLELAEPADDAPLPGAPSDPESPGG